MKIANQGCPAELLPGLIKDSLDPDTTKQVQAHLDHCTSCQQRLESLAGGKDWQGAAADALKGQAIVASRFTGDSDVPGLAPSSVLPTSLLDAADDPRWIGRFAGYDVAGLVGMGSTGIVLKAYDRPLDRYVAIKVLQPAAAGMPGTRERFEREGRAAASVVHDNVIAVYSVDQHGELPFIVMPYVGGTSLQRYIETVESITAEEILGVSLQIARGLAAAHGQGLIHRDIKPANILTIDQVPRIVITDFGLARHGDRSDLTQSGMVAGTPQYMSPEQACGQTIDARSDLFSLGAVMFAMATGKPPFDGESPYTVVREIVDHPHPDLQTIRPDLPSWLVRIIDRLLAKDPAERFRDASELAEHLENSLAYLRHPDTATLPAMPPSLGQPRHPESRSLWTTTALVAVTLVPVLIAGWFLWPLGKDPPVGRSNRLADSDDAVVGEAATSAVPVERGIATPDSAVDTQLLMSPIDQRLDQIESDLIRLDADLDPFRVP